MAAAFLFLLGFPLQAQTDSNAMAEAIRNLPSLSSINLPRTQTGSQVASPQPVFGFNQITTQVKNTSGAHPLLDLKSQGSMSENFPAKDMSIQVSYAVPTNDLWLEMLPASNDLARLMLHGASNEVYELMSRVSWDAGPWQPEQTLHRSTNQDGIFTVVPVLGRTNNMFFWVRDWTGVDENTNSIPDWWEWGKLWRSDFGCGEGF